jgi:hypothetical protein
VSSALAASTNKAVAEPDDSDALFEKLKGWVRGDYLAMSDWLKEAEEDFDFVSNHQWDDQTKKLLEGQKRPATTFNLVGAMVQAVAGYEISNRQETQYIPRHVGSAGVSELVTAAVKYFRDNADAENAESAAFLSAVICGLGWTETYIDFDDNVDGDYKKRRVSYKEIIPDSRATDPNLTDARRVARIREMTVDEALELFEGVEEGDLNAAWIDGDEDKKASHNDPKSRYDSDDNHEGEGEKTVKIVECQWYEFEKFARFIDPATGQEQRLSIPEFDTLSERYPLLGMPIPKAVFQRRKVYRRAFLGSKLLAEVELPVDGHFTYQPMTGSRDENRNCFYGIVRALKDPQRWVNKLFSQTMHILNTNSKGGIMAERGAFENDRKAAESWAKADGITWVNSGALQNGQIQPKPVAQVPPAFFQLMEFAMSMGPRVSGINLEFLGMREANQAGVLEYQRRQAGVTILAPLFDSLRLHRIQCGRMDLALIQTYLSDGRLIRIAGPEGQQFLPLSRDRTLGEYEVIVDDAPTSPNQKEKTWAITQQMMPVLGPLFQANPELAAEFIVNSPLPESANRKIAAALKKPNPNAGEQAAAAKAAAFAKINRDDAASEKDKATALKTLSEIMVPIPPMMPPIVEGPFPVMPPGPPMPPPGMPGMPPMGPGAMPGGPMPGMQPMPQGGPPMPPQMPPGMPGL